MKKIFSIFLLSFVAIGLSGQQVGLTLQQCKDMALVNDPYVKNSYLDVMAAEAQKKEVLNQCRTYGVIDIDKMLSAESLLGRQFDEIRSKRERDEEITAEDTAIVIESPVEVTVCERHEFNIEKWATEVVADQEAFVAGLEASGESTEDEETQEIIAICKENIQNLKDNVLVHAQHATNDTEERQDK
jgi:hypothetical protein